MRLEDKKWFVADFETTGSNYLEDNNATRVWLYAICDSNATITNYGSSIEEFFKELSNMRMNVIYFHNLKFDGSFILNYLLNNGFEYKDNLRVKDNRGFSTLIGEMGEFYQIKINFARNKQVIILDSYKVLPFKVKKIANDFELEIKKGEIDYSDYTINDEKLEYVFNDVKIVAKALSRVKTMGMIKMTTASSAYNEFISSVKEPKLIFPELSDEFLEGFRLAYRGGRSQVNPLYQGKLLHNVKRFDINSMYPYIMHDMLLPYGEPIPIKKMGHFKFELYKVNIKFKLKNGHLPTLLQKGSVYGIDSYYKDTNNEIIELYISSIDFELLKLHYDILYLEPIEMYGFATNRNIFKNYIDKWYNLKNTSTGALKVVCKLMLNSLYGKFGSNYKGRKKLPKLLNEKLAFEKSEEQEMKKYYLPIAIAITSYAHKLIDENIMITGYDKFVYCDTDSIHTLGTLNENDIDNKQLGKFKLEAIETRSKYIRQKCYCTEEIITNKENGNKEKFVNITCAGMPQNLKDYAIELYKDNIFDKFDVGLKLDGKLVPYQCRGGVVLKETTFEIK